MVIDPRSGQYNAASPDELALIEGAKAMGIVLEGKDEEGMVTIRNVRTNTEWKYKILAVLEFTSERKRMSVLVQDLQSPGSSKVYLFSKGADTVLYPKLVSY